MGKCISLSGGSGGCIAVRLGDLDLGGLPACLPACLVKSRQAREKVVVMLASSKNRERLILYVFTRKKYTYFRKNGCLNTIS